MIGRLLPILHCHPDWHLLTNYLSAVNSGTTLCTQLSPFRLRVMFDDGEVLSSDSSKVSHKLIWFDEYGSLHFTREFTGCLYHSRLVERPIGSRGSSFESIWILKPWLECDRCLINCYFDFCWFFISLFETATRFVEHLHLLQEQLIHLMNVQLSGGNLFL